MATWRRCLRLVLVLLLLLLAAMTTTSAAPEDRPALIYHVHLPLFRDGASDLAGVTRHLGYLAGLGVDAVWLPPVFPASVDGYATGHRVTNFTDVDPALGDVASFQRLVDAAASLGMKVLLEFVPNHTSDLHKWFQRSVERQEPYTDYYVWKDGVQVDSVAGREPPNNWLSVTGGSAWTWHEDRGQFFLHQFGDTQPDLNYWNEDVRREVEGILKFWLQRGVSGFVLSGVSHLYESRDLLDEPSRSTGSDWEYSHLVHRNTLDLPETYLQVRRWHRMVHEFGRSNNSTRFVVVESHSSLPSTLAYYGSEEEPIADMPLNFRFLSSLRLNNSAKEMETVIKDWLFNMPQGTTPNWMVGSDTLNDMVTHFSAHKVDALNAMLQILPGVVVVYNGDIAAESAWEEYADYGSRAAGSEPYPSLGLDLSLPFSSVTTGSSNETNLLQSDSNHVDEITSHNPEDVHSRLLKKVSLRHSIPTLQSGDIMVSAVSTDVLLLVRTLDGWDTFAAVINFGESITAVNISILLENVTLVMVYTSSSNCGFEEGETISSPKVSLPPHASVVLRLCYSPSNNTELTTEESDLEFEQLLRDSDTSTAMYENITEAESEMFENNTEVPTTDTLDAATIPTEVNVDETSTVALENSTEVSFQITGTSTEYSPDTQDNGTEISEAIGDSTQNEVDAAGIENRMDRPKSAVGNSPEIFSVSAESIDKLPTFDEPPCKTCTKANQQTEPPTTTSAGNAVGKRYSPHLLFAPLLILVLVLLL